MVVMWYWGEGVSNSRGATLRVVIHRKSTAVLTYFTYRRSLSSTQTDCLPMSGDPSKAAAVGELSREPSPCPESATIVYPIL